MFKHNSKGLAAIQYAGLEGISGQCLDAVIRLIQCRVHIISVRILTCHNHHGLLIDVVPGDMLAVRAGFTSGYSGEGPRCFSYVLSLLEAHGVKVEEIDVSPDAMMRLNASALTAKDLATIESTDPIRPKRCYDYIWEKHYADAQNGHLWKDFYPVIPYAIIDPRIIDLAISFWTSPDEKLMTGFRRLEDIIRKRSDIQEYGAKLFSQAFVKD